MTFDADSRRPEAEPSETDRTDYRNSTPPRFQPLATEHTDPTGPMPPAAETGPAADPDTDSDTAEKKKQEESTGSVLWEVAETLVLALFIFLAVRAVVLNFRVDGLSMEPTLDSGQMLLVNRQIYFHFDVNDVLNILPFVEREGEDVFYPLHPPQRGDIVVFDPPIGQSGKPYIKRVIGLPGEHLAIHDGSVYIDGERLEEPYLGATATSWPGRQPDYEIVVPEGHIFVLGDNRNNSTDSRSFGPVSVDDVIGKAWVSYWPQEHLGILSTPAYWLPW